MYAIRKSKFITLTSFLNFIHEWELPMLEEDLLPILCPSLFGGFFLINKKFTVYCRRKSYCFFTHYRRKFIHKFRSAEKQFYSVLKKVCF